MYECHLTLAQKLDIPVVGISTTRVWRLAELAVGNPYNPALRNERSKYSQSWTFLDRLHSLCDYVQINIYPLFIPSSIDRIYRQYYGSYFQLEKKISLLFVNNHASLLSRPSVPNAIDIGGIHLSPPNHLPEVSECLLFTTDVNRFMALRRSRRRRRMMKRTIPNRPVAKIFL